jgi:hypothetical protein
MIQDLVESDCSVHGLDPHVRAHEAGHALAALAFGIPFRGVIVYAEDDEPSMGVFESAAAQITMLSDDHSTWVQPDPLSAMRFVLGGVAGEFAVFDDSIYESYRGDIKSWRKGFTDSTEELDQAAIDDALGTPMMTVYLETVDWARANVDDIKKLANHLATLPKSTEMSRDEIIALLEA